MIASLWYPKKEAFQLLKHNRGLLLHLHYTTVSSVVPTGLNDAGV